MDAQVAIAIRSPRDEASKSELDNHLKNIIVGTTTNMFRPRQKKSSIDWFDDGGKHCHHQHGGNVLCHTSVQKFED